MSETERLRLLAKASQVFSPGAPINRYTLFAGRTRQVQDVITAVNQRGQHVILYGERGVGKTSLANVMSDVLSHIGQKGLRSGTINCDSSDDFTSIWRKVLREMAVQVKKAPIGFGGKEKISDVSLDELVSEDVRPEDIRFILEHYGKGYVIVIDELDRVSASGVTTQLADTIKTLSDHSVETTIILVGVADSVDQLISEHQSIERALKQIPMPRMSTDEIAEIVDKGLAELSMAISTEGKKRIVHLSQGLPHYTHLLSLNAVRTAIWDERLDLDVHDVNLAIKSAVSDAQQSIISAHHKAISSPRKDNLFSRVLLACALAETDQLGYFAAADVRSPMSSIMGKRYDIPAFSRHLNDFCDENRGPVLQKTGSPRRYRFRFINPLMQPYIIMHGFKERLCDPKLILN